MSCEGDEKFVSSMQALAEMGFSDDFAFDTLVSCKGDHYAALEILLNGNCGPLQPPNSNLRQISNVHQLPISQYTFCGVGVSACTSISCQAVVTLLSIIENCNKSKMPTAISDDVLTDIILSGVHYYNVCGELNPSEHWSVDEFLQCSPEMKTMLTVHTEVPIQGLLTTPHAIKHALEQARLLANPHKPIGILITKPPETISLILPANDITNDSEYMLFDSHPRPHLGYHGAYLVGTSSVNDILTALSDIFLPFPATSDMPIEGDHMLQMFNSFECTVVQLINRHEDPLTEIEAQGPT